jgi:hypothetical protein
VNTLLHAIVYVFTQFSERAATDLQIKWDYKRNINSYSYTIFSFSRTFLNKCEIRLRAMLLSITRCVMFQELLF